MLTLYIGNKNYSSWSLRPWLLLTHAGIQFEERRLALFSPEFKARVAEVSPAGCVPVLIDDGFAVWDTLAIAEYAAERFPEKRLWPGETRARARARSVCAEMHSGFGALRQALQMNIEASLPAGLLTLAVRRDIERLISMWNELRAEHGGRGSFLFGAFSVADAFFAPVVTRFRTYAVEVTGAAGEYAQMMWELPAMRAWVAGALAEKTYIPEEEPYRVQR